MKPLHLLIIGAGGTTSYLMPVLLRSFDIHRIVLMDKDVLEERNLDRQLFDSEDVGYAKAYILAKKYNRSGNIISPLSAWFDGTCSRTPEQQDFRADLINTRIIIALADNHRSRRDALALADELKVPCIAGGNELYDNEAFLYDPKASTPCDIRKMYPEVLTDDTGSPFSCQVVQEENKQLALANFGNAYKCAKLILNYLEGHNTCGYVGTKYQEETLTYNGIFTT